MKTLFLAILIITISFQYSTSVDAEGNSCMCTEEFEKYVRILLASSIEKYSSCAEIVAARPASPSGVYTLHYDDQTSEEVYCLMDSLPGCGKGGWRRVGYLNLTMADQDCPSGLTESSESGTRVCSFTDIDGEGCRSVFFTTNGQKYSQVCGFVRGYSIGSPDSFARFGSAMNTNKNNISAAYLDGVSITYGSPRQHLWSYVSSQLTQAGMTECPCTRDSSIVDPPPFVGSHYYCESGSSDTSNALWDGQQCTDPENTNGCCSIPELPWFHRVLPDTSDMIELRLCRDEVGEDIPVDQYEIYVQ